MPSKGEKLVKNMSFENAHKNIQVHSIKSIKVVVKFQDTEKVKM